MFHIAPSCKDALRCFLVCVAVCLPGVLSSFRSQNLSPELSTCFGRFASVTLDRVVGKLLFWHCEFAMTPRNTYGPFLSPTEWNYMYGLLQRISGFRHRLGKRQARRCVRKEYRTLTTRERDDYHRAVNQLKHNTKVSPNVYDALAKLHSAGTIPKAHGGPCFLGWHRVFLLMYELALGDEVPGVCLPYWDSSLDNELDDPAQTYMFSPELMGTGRGPVTTGPFAGWRRPRYNANITSRQPPLIRNVGVDGQLYSRKIIEDILSRKDHSEIIAPNSDPDYDIEVQHGGVHMFVGGDMEELETAPFDPIFYMHHAFVDYIWELFRLKLRNEVNIDPSKNYPMNHKIAFHSRDEIMTIGNLSCGEGYSDRLMESVEYEASPSCSAQRPTCNSQYLRCRSEDGRCIPITLEESPLPLNPVPVNPSPGPIRPQPGPINPRPFPLQPTPLPLQPRPLPVNPRPRPVNPRPVPIHPRPLPINPHPGPIGPQPGPNMPPPVDPCAHIEREKHNVKPYQNTYCINGICDINQWVYVPVKVVTMRPPGFNKYRSYPVFNGDISTVNDIYNPSAYARAKRLIQGQLGRVPKAFAQCFDDGIGQIFVHSHGLNYDGVYKESAIVDQRLATTLSIAYIAVKDPGHRGNTQVMLRAADSCGRVCHAACKNPRTGVFERCSGVIELDSLPPRMYSKNYGDATLDIWNYGAGNVVQCPIFNDDKFFITFYCNYEDHLPWLQRIPLSPNPEPEPVVLKPPPVVEKQVCQVSRTCVLEVSCFSAKLQCRFYGERHQCRGICGLYAVCNYGHYTEKYCGGGMAFNEVTGQCSTVHCSSQRVSVHVQPPVFGPDINYLQSLEKRMLNIG
ncbi:uncharacterized protein LOC121388778 [Gigantopelta aegis]|uniref:uncharacterized protein LOC121388778 n=1 Tax=Gigantopelta aegis TaxID=1735272 RepID=UPI001B8881A3|nr:uncharacterized protein LOC121388778 [Gigantopelta aegis]